jgi:hypothetical protein
MDWLILVLGVPAILVPLVLLFGFAGCTPAAHPCTDDSDCPVGTQCGAGGQCIAVGVEPNPPPLLPPDNLAAIALDDHSVRLTWHNTDPAVTDISFQIERTPENGEPVVIPPPGDLSPTGATDAFELRGQEGVTFIYRVRALLGEETSDDASNESRGHGFSRSPEELGRHSGEHQPDRPSLGQCFRD